MIVLQEISVIMLFIVVPGLVGDYVRHFTKIEYSLSADYIIGMITMWALFQVWAVPLILLKTNFLLLVALFSISVGVLAALEVLHLLRKRKEIKIRKKKEWKKDLISIVAITIMCFLIAQQGYMYVRYMHLDADDSRFVVNALETQENHTMLLTNPATGTYEDTWVGDLSKDVASPWAIYIAAMGTLTGVHATVMAHTVLPVFLLITAYAGYWMLAGTILGKNRLNQSIFVTLVALINEFFNASVYTESTFLLTRVWQGKAVVAGVLLPVLLLLLIQILQNRKCREYYFLLCIGMFAICLMSGMGIVLGAVFVGVFGTVYALSCKDWGMLVKTAVACLPNVVYGLIHFGLK